MSSTEANWLSAERGSRLGLAGSASAARSAAGSSASSATCSIALIALFRGATCSPPWSQMSSFICR
eukprot:11660904-Heterocapsa_arctica.AAC.1